MKHSSHLLDDVLEGGNCTGPDAGEVLAMVREVHTQRRKRHAALLGAGAALAIMVAVSVLHSPAPEPHVAAAPKTKSVTTPPGAPVFQTVNDDELLSLLEGTGTPTALMEWPDGRRTLVVMQRNLP